MYMPAGIEREKALELVHANIKNPNMVKHCLASEVVLIALAKRLGEDESLWGMAGLLHDLDVEETESQMSMHGKKTVEMLMPLGVNPEITEAILMHNEQASGKQRSKRFHHALAAGETITGLNTATALVYPDKKLSSVKVKSIVKRMKEKAFAASVDRDIIWECGCIDVPLKNLQS